MMDTSETYIKMCDCPEIQQWERHCIFPREGDLFACITLGHKDAPVELVIGTTPPRADKKDNRDLFKGKYWVWLPRQDQIQEMIYPHQDGIAYLTCELYGWLQRQRKYQPKSMEQLWLALYMHEKHNKVWDGEKWIKA